jgi:DNA-binding response OmpR family regulator
MAKKILAVDDEIGIAKLIKANLARVGYEVDMAHNGVDGLRMLMAQPYDLLISDVMMPQMDGLELVNTLRSDPDLAALPVILLTAKSTDEDVASGYMNGTDLYLTKPFSPSELLAWVERLIGSSDS